MRKPAQANRITGASRTQLAADLKAQYEQGANIRALAKTTGRSYGFVHQVLNEAQAALRGRGAPGSLGRADTGEQDHIEQPPQLQSIDVGQLRGEWSPTR